MYRKNKAKCKSQAKHASQVGNIECDLELNHKSNHQAGSETQRVYWIDGEQLSHFYKKRNNENG